MAIPDGVFAFRFPQVFRRGLLDLFATGRQTVTDPGYRWHGRERTDGPLCLFQYTRQGSGVFEQGGRSWRVGPGQGFLVDIPSDHLYRIDPQPGFWHLDFVLFRPAHAEALWRPVVAGLGPVARFPEGRGPAAALETLVRAAAEGRIQDEFEASALTYQLLVALGRHAVQPSVPLPPASVSRALRLLDEGWSRPWNLTEVARAVGLSPAYFHRLFRLHTGVTPLEWLTRRRMERAVELLGAPGARVTAVARSLGFADAGYFIRVFRRWTGTTPGALLANPSAWAGSKIVLSTRQSTDGAPGFPGGILRP